MAPIRTKIEFAGALAAVLSSGSAAQSGVARPLAPEVPGAAMHPADLPALPLWAPALAAPSAAVSLSAAAAPTSAAPAARALPLLARDVARDEAAAKLEEAGLPELLREHGLIAWHIQKARTRGGERVFLTLSLPTDGRPFEPGADDPARHVELGRRIAAAEGRVVAEVARILGLDDDRISVSGRLIESCCGRGCQPCLLTKEPHARRWTGQAPRETADAR